ncbi:MAG: SUF system Fe-S cluster assembly regulator [Steroidobacteraceae bacterium]
MFKISRLTDYATVLLAELTEPSGALRTAAQMAQRTGIGAATVSKLLKQLQRAGLVQSTRGAQGGYRLARPPESISAADILDALEGPVRLTDCAHGEHRCELQNHCQVERSWQRVSLSFRAMLQQLTLAEMAGLVPQTVRIPLSQLDPGKPLPRSTAR